MDDGSSTPSIVIIGAGLAGLFAALKLAPLPVTVISPAPLGEAASSAWAQGGIAAAVGYGDTPAAHARDTIEAGAGLVDEDVALSVAREAGDRIRDLLGFGVPFDRDLEGHFVLSREAAHSENRVVRVTGDRAGKAIMEALIASVRASEHIRIVEGYAASQITTDKNGRVDGVVLEPCGNGRRRALEGVSELILATGGVGGLYAVTTNPPTAVGSGIAMAARAGAVIQDAEFVQFHPTAIATGTDPAPLASEALRGEGAILVDRDGRRFMPAIHADAELAPRDIVARAVFSEIAAGRGAFLDCREAIGAAFAEHFPTVYEKCRQAGIDPVNEPIPVVPAEHYHMGGVQTDTAGRTRVAGLWAVGEVAATGLHGANRLASNSLLEAVVFAARASEIIRLQRAHTTSPAAHWRSLPPAPQCDEEHRTKLRQGIRATMADYVGVVRTADGLKTALATLKTIEIEAGADADVCNMVLAAHFITEAALRRRESRGGHYRSDYPLPVAGRGKRSSITLAGLSLRDGSAIRDILHEISHAGKETH